jgi:hypothetical protein
VQNDLFICPEFEPMMALSVGDEAVAYTKASGVVWGKHIQDQIIGRGLGIDSRHSIVGAHSYSLLTSTGCSEYLRFDPTKYTREEVQAPI